MISLNHFCAEIDKAKEIHINGKNAVQKDKFLQEVQPKNKKAHVRKVTLHGDIVDEKDGQKWSPVLTEFLKVPAQTNNLCINFNKFDPKTVTFRS